MNLFDIYPLMDVEPESAEGSWITDTSGNKYLDLYGGHAVISIGHSHPHYVQRLNTQLEKIGFYSNSVQNPLQKKLAEKIGKISGFQDFNLFLCNSGTEANEAALKLASYHTGKQGVISFSQGFHGRTAGSMSASDNSCITVPSPESPNVHFAELNNFHQVESILQNHEIGAIIVESIQGIGGINMVSRDFYHGLLWLCQQHGALLIMDEVQAGSGRTGKFFSFQHYSEGLNPDIITMAKGMGNGFPVGGVLIHPKIQSMYGLLGSTFGGNYMACSAVLAVLEVIEKTSLLKNAEEIGEFVFNHVADLKGLIEVRGKGLMIGLEFDFPVKDLRAELVKKHRILTGSSSNPNVLRILPSLAIRKEEIELFISALKKLLSEKKYHETVYLG